ncbi:MAG TPA: tetratricopeptide repeat protein [Kofleriaceae bacterium]|nr:tetratricopeptide repeat protein [Kofleriaceae bacterium]
MSLAIRLLGEPRLVRDGEPVAGPRGNKAWAVLAYLVCCRQPPGRRKLAELLFGEADDPLGALRWSLAQLRQALGQSDAVRGDPVALALAADTDVDLRALRSARPHDATELEGLTGELLEGMSFSASPVFEAWLAAERRQVAATVEALLLERAQAALGAGRADAAERMAARLVELNPLEENHQEVLVRCLLAAGDHRGALARVEDYEQLSLREMAAPAPARLRDLVRAAAGPPAAASPAGQAAASLASAAAVRAQLEAGKAAIGAGAVDAGLESLRRACAAAEACGDGYLHARGHLALGSALAHSMRAYGEAAPALHRAIDAAQRIGAHAIAATAHRELGFIDVQAGRGDQAEVWLALAAAEAAGVDEELASIGSVRAMARIDAARYEEAIEALEEAIERGLRCEHKKQVAHSLSHLGRAYVLTGRRALAREKLERALELVEEEKWIAFAPMPEAMLAHVELAEGRAGEARDLLDHAFAIACNLGDPCWEAMACRGLALAEIAAGNHAQGVAWMTDGRARSIRIAHPYQWIHGWLLEGLCRVGRNDERAALWIDQLEALASRTGMRELLLRAYLHRAQRGDARSRDAATLLGAEIDNPSIWGDPPT